MPYCDYSLQGVGDGSHVIQQETEITTLSVIGLGFVIFYRNENLADARMADRFRPFLTLAHSWAIPSHTTQDFGAP